MCIRDRYNAGGPVVVHAQENAVVTEKLGETAASQEGVIDFSAIKDNDCLLYTSRCV